MPISWPGCWRWRTSDSGTSATGATAAAASAIHPSCSRPLPDAATASGRGNARSVTAARNAMVAPVTVPPSAVLARHEHAERVVVVDRLPFPRPQADGRPAGRAEGPRLLVDQLAVREREPDRPGTGERGPQAGELLRQPHVVLVGEHDDVPAAAPDRRLEVPRRAQSAVVHVPDHREGGPRREPVDHRDRLVGRAVVGHDELVGRGRLAGDAVELLLQEARTLVGRERDRDPHAQCAPVTLGSARGSGAGAPRRSGTRSVQPAPTPRSTGPGRRRAARSCG